ncbi:MAG: hypothetical protein H7336_14830, partial [Bacteriovorax sp.]|nr:hypothetical protein [Bacteriovorax sp.]
SKYKNVAIYKAISEALERLAFYETGEKEEKNFCFDLNPTTTGLAAFPHFNSNQARLNAKAEAIERWAIHEFNRSRLPVNAKYTTIKKLNYYEILTPFKEIVVTLLSFHHENFYAYSFAAGINSQHSFDRALIELDRNIRVLKKSKEENRKYNDASPGVDKTILYFSTEEGYSTFQNYIERSPSRITNTFPIVICDKELKGYWTQYAKVWRYLLEDSYFNCTTDHTFFMF